MIQSRPDILIMVAPLLENHSIRRIINLLKLNISPQILSSWLRQDPPLRSPYYLTEYKCKNCRSSWLIWKIFFGRLRQLVCPDCQGPCVQSFSIPMPDFFPQLTPYVLWRAEVVILKGAPLKQFQEKRKISTLLKYPLYLHQSQTNRRRSFHIVYRDGETAWMTHCCRKYTNRNARPLNSRDPVFSAELVCLPCLKNLIVSKSTTWKPNPLNRPQSRSYEDVELMIEARDLGNITLACSRRHLSPRAFYDARRRQPDLYYALFFKGIK